MDDGRKLLAAGWNITDDGDVVEKIGDMPVVIYHTGDAAMAELLIKERQALMRSVIFRHLERD